MIIGILFLLRLSTVCAAQQTDNVFFELRVGAYENYPKIYTDARGRIAGFFPEILNYIASAEGWHLQYVKGTWTECLKRLDDKQLDIMVDVAFSAKREMRYDFNRESLLVNWGVLYAGSGVQIESFLDLDQKKIAVMAGSIHTVGKDGIKNLLKRFSIHGSFIEVEDYRKVFELVELHQADCGVVNRIFGQQFEKDYNVHRTPLIFNPRQLKFAFPKNFPQNKLLIDTIDQHIASFKKDTNSVYYKALDMFLSGQTGQRLHTDGSANKQPVLLSRKEKAWLEKHPQIRFAVDPEFQPFEYIDEKGEFRGIASDYVRILKERAGVNLVRVENIDWKTAVEKARKKEIDVFPCVGKTMSRLQYLLYSKPYIKFHRVMITRIDSPFISKLSDVRNLRVAVQDNSSHEGFLQDASDIKPVKYATLQEVLLAVSTGRADVMVGNIASATYWIRKLNLTNLKIAAPVTPGVQNLYFAVRKDWPILVSITNKVLASVSQGYENEIFQKWIDIEYDRGISPEKVWKNVIRFGGLALLFLMGIVAWNYRLKREIAAREKMEKKLQYRNEFERLVSEISSRLIASVPEQVNEDVETALWALSKFTDTDYVGLFAFDEGQKIFSCTHLWHSEGIHINRKRLSDIELNQTPWWKERIQSQKVIAVSSISELPEEANRIRGVIQAQGVKAFIDVPRVYLDRVVGFLRLGSARDTRHWNSDEIDLLKLIGQILTNALLRTEAEESLKSYSSELARANRRLRDLDQLKSMFIASMSHELRTPLNSIIGFTGVILQGMSGDLNARQTDQLQRVYQSARHLLALITDVIDISKIEAGRIDVFPEDFVMDELIQEAMDSVRTMQEAKKLTLDLDMEENVTVQTDRRRLLQCIINLLSNAVKYTEKGGIRLSVHSQNGSVNISIKDTGIGIAATDLPRLFEPFERLDSHLRVKAGGAGLGLYLTQKLARDILQGHLSVVSQPGEGSVFTLSIPKHLHECSDSDSRNKAGVNNAACVGN